jgi:twinkle protein
MSTIKKTDLTERSAELLEARGIDIELAINLGVQSCDRPGRDPVAIPYYRNGEAINHKYRTVPMGKKNCEMDSGAPLAFWNGDAIHDRTLRDAPLIITEGEFDGMVAMQAGHRRVVSVPNGAPPAYGQKYPWLDPYLSALKEISPIVLAVDGDNAGANLLHDLALQLGRVKCKWVSYPTGKDLNDLWLAGGPALVNRALAEARWVHVDGVYSLSELPPLPKIDAYDPGFGSLADHYRMRCHDFCVIVGVPSMGKTSWLNDLACRAVRNHGWHIALASFEQTPQLDLKRNLRAWYSDKPGWQQSPAERDAADSWINDNFSFIVPGDDDEVNMAWMAERIDAAILRNGAKLVIVDPWNEMELIHPPEMSHTNYLGAVIREFKRIARKYLVHVIVAAHPAKMRAETKDGKRIIPMPSLYDIADTAHFANKADVGIVIHRDEETQDTIIKVAKSRYHDQIGRPGEVRMMFDKDRMKFTTREDLV